MTPRRPRLPVWPLVARVEREYVTAPFAPGDPLRRTWVHARQRGYVKPETADLLTVRLLNVHPCDVWPEWFDLPD
jgi:hypothetical protein